MGSFECQPLLWVINQDLVHLVLRNSSGQHLGHNVFQNVRVAMPAIFGQAVLGVNVMCYHNAVLISLFNKIG